MEFHHVPVLAQQCMDALAVRPDGVYVDGTTGGGGHSSLIAQRLDERGRLVCIDRDDDALRAARGRLAGFACRIDFVKSNFTEIDAVLRDLGIPAVQGILLDLGVSSYQLDTPERGFSYKNDAPLDMRMDRTQKLTARDVVNGYSEQSLRELIGGLRRRAVRGAYRSGHCGPPEGQAHRDDGGTERDRPRGDAGGGPARKTAPGQADLSGDPN